MLYEEKSGNPGKEQWPWLTIEGVKEDATNYQKSWDEAGGNDTTMYIGKYATQSSRLASIVTKYVDSNQNFDGVIHMYIYIHRLHMIQWYSWGISIT
jgi:hypothetical protein